MTMLDTDIEILLSMEVDEPILCESGLHAPMQPHEAHWMAVAACGRVDYMCDKRRRQFRGTGGWPCVPGCNEYHHVGDVSWEPIDRSR